MLGQSESLQVFAPSSALKKQERLIAWNVEILSGHLRKIVARRLAKKNGKRQLSTSFVFTPNGDGMTALDEVQEIIEMPDFDPVIAGKEAKLTSVFIEAEVIAQLRQYVTAIANMYHGECE